MTSRARPFLLVAFAATLCIAGCGDSGGTSSTPDPGVDGPYGVGTTSVRFERPSSTTGETRVLDTVLWYPVAPGASGEAFQGGVRDADVARGGPFPLLMFSHGSCGTPGQSKFLVTRLASYGFVVAAPPHPGNTLLDSPSVDRCLNPANLVDSFLNRPDDIERALDGVLELGATDARFAGTIDASRIGVFGHSFGGQTAVRVAATDARIGALLTLAPARTALVLGQAEQLRIPTMLQAAEDDSIATFEEQQVPLFARLPEPKFLVEILDTGHFAFADVCLAPSGSAYSDCLPGGLTQDQAHAVVVRWAVPFLGLYVAGDARWAPLLAPGPDTPGVVYDARATLP
jgi:predicted dienelactone hydrolase